MKKLLSLTICLIMIPAFASCKNNISESPDTSVQNTTEESVSQEAASEGTLYTEDTVIGDGRTQIKVTVEAPEKTVVITVKTDEKVLGDALIKCGLVEGEEGPYGLYIKKVNGISAVYETDGAYWSLTVGGETAVTGADSIDITDGGEYGLIYTKA
ncbi:MAG: DUF4430 domain-containing protein [Clostridia bacterium]|nr:DUF4430 domain-containing protein [Clostridia bacterium]